MRAVVGKPSTPTPAGLAAIYERDRQPGSARLPGPLGPLADRALQHARRTSAAARGRVGIHGRDGASLLDPLGSARSHGCIRIEDREIRWMAAHLPVGTPVRIGSGQIQTVAAPAARERRRRAAAAHPVTPPAALRQTAHAHRRGAAAGLRVVGPGHRDVSQGRGVGAACHRALRGKVRPP